MSVSKRILIDPKNALWDFQASMYAQTKTITKMTRINSINFFKKNLIDLEVFVFILLVTFIVFGIQSKDLGFYADDATWLSKPDNLTFSALLEEIKGYVTGRNLHVLWQYFVYLFFGKSVESLGAHHLLMAFVTGANAALVYCLLRLFGFFHIVAFIASILFAFYPNHAEVQYWLTALPQNLISTSFVLTLFLICLITIRKMGNPDFKRVDTLFVAAFIVYILALFTYDQVVPVIVGVVVLVGLLGVINKRIRLRAILFLMACLSPIPVLLLWKINVPGGGPVMSNLNISHVANNFQFSISNYFGYHFQAPLRILLDNVSYEQKIISLGFVLVISLVAITICWYQFSSQKFTSINKTPLIKWGLYSFPSWVVWPVWVVCTIFIYILTYLPAYIWYLAPRHHYLPGIGVAMAFAVIASMFLEISSRVLGRWGLLIAGIVLVVLSAKYTYQFIKVDLVEKKIWSESFQGRKHLYTELEKGGQLEGISTLILGEFPSTTSLGTAPFGYQPHGEVELITNGRIVVTNLDRKIQPAITGVYIYASANDYGLNAFRFAPWGNTLILRYQDLNKGAIKYKIVDPRSLKPGYSFNNATPINGHVKYSAEKDGKGLRISIPNLELKQGEVMTLLPLYFADGKITPLPFNNKNNAPTSLLLEIPRHLMSHQIYVQLPSGLPDIEEIGLYVSSEDADSRLIDQVKVVQSHQ